MQQLRDKLAVAERTARSEAQLKVRFSKMNLIIFLTQNSGKRRVKTSVDLLLASQEKFQLRLKVLEEGLRMSSSGSNRCDIDGKSLSSSSSRRQSLREAENVSKLSPNGFLPRRSPSFQIRSSLSNSTSTVLKHAKGTSKSFDGGTRSLDRGKIPGNGTGHSLNRSIDGTRDNESSSVWKENQDEKPPELTNADSEDTVSGLLYDMLQKEVVTLRKACHEKDQSLKDKDDAIEVDAVLEVLQLCPVSSLSPLSPKCCLTFHIFCHIDVSKES